MYMYMYVLGRNSQKVDRGRKSNTLIISLSPFRLCSWRYEYSLESDPLSHCGLESGTDRHRSGTDPCRGYIHVYCTLHLYINITKLVVKEENPDPIHHT